VAAMVNSSLSLVEIKKKKKIVTYMFVMNCRDASFRLEPAKRWLDKISS
jgi:hypothetical protein